MSIRRIIREEANSPRYRGKKKAFAICSANISPKEERPKWRRCVKKVAKKEGIEVKESLKTLRGIVAESSDAKRLAASTGVSYDATRDGSHVVLSHPTLGRKVVRALGGKVSPAEVNKFLSEKKRARVQEDIPLGSLVTAKTLAIRQQNPVTVKRNGLLPISGLRKGQAQIWKDDRGKVIGYDGNNYTLMLNNSGRVVASKEDFKQLFEPVKDEDLLLL